MITLGDCKEQLFSLLRSKHMPVDSYSASMATACADLEATIRTMRVSSTNLLAEYYADDPFEGAALQGNLCLRRAFYAALVTAIHQYYSAINVGIDPLEVIEMVNYATALHELL